jgi:hypothetical protein
MAGVLHETFRFSNKNLGQFNERYIFSDSGSHYISSGHAFRISLEARVFQHWESGVFEIHRLLLGPAMELVQAGKEKRGSEWGYSTFSRYFNALGKANFPRPAPIATLQPRSFCRDATAAQIPLQHLVPSR